MSCWNNTSDHRECDLVAVLTAGRYAYICASATQSSTRSRKAPFPPDSEANTLSEDTRLARSDVSPASSVKLSVPPQPSQLKPKREKMGQGGQQDTTLT